MPAKLVMTVGPTPGTEFHIQEEVLRLGSGTQCEFCFSAANVAPHAATLEYRNGEYTLHNRTEESIEITGRRLGLRESAPWPEGEEAVFGRSGLALRLEVQGDPAPSKSNVPAYKIEYDADEEAEESEAASRAATEKAKAGSKTMVQMVVILGCVALCAVMLLNDPGPEVAKSDPRVDFEKIIKKLADDPTDNARGPNSLRATLQRARAAEMRGDTKEVRKAYGLARDTVLKRRRPDETFADDDREIWEFVNARIQAIHGPILP